MDDIQATVWQSWCWFRGQEVWPCTQHGLSVQCTSSHWRATSLWKYGVQDDICTSCGKTNRQKNTTHGPNRESVRIVWSKTNVFKLQKSISLLKHSKNQYISLKLQKSISLFKIAKINISLQNCKNLYLSLKLQKIKYLSLKGKNQYVSMKLCLVH